MQCTVCELEVRGRTGSHKQKEEERRSLDRMMHLPAEAACSCTRIHPSVLPAEFDSVFALRRRS